MSRARPVRLRGLAAAAFLGAIAAIGCRPTAVLDTEAPGASAGTVATASAMPAAKLMPDQTVSIQVQLFRGFGPADAALQYAQALDIFRPVNLAVNLAPPIAGYDPFTVEPSPGSMTVWIGTLADVAPAAAAGTILEAVGALTGRDPTVLVEPTDAATSLASLTGKTVIADTAGSAASFRAALAAAGVDPKSVTVTLPDDPSAPFDPSALIGGDAAAAAVSEYDGWARVEEALSGAGMDPAAFQARPLRDPGSALLGELVWVRPADMSDPQLSAATAALLATIATAQVSCRDALTDCAGAAAAQSDRTQDGIAWSIDQLDRMLFPAPQGIVRIDEAAWTRTLAAMDAAGVSGASKLTMTNEVADRVLASIRGSVDVTGSSWAPGSPAPLIGSPGSGSSAAP